MFHLHSDFDTSIWRKSRQQAHLEVERILRDFSSSSSSSSSVSADHHSGMDTAISTDAARSPTPTCSQHHLIIVDDNMYYRSMRHSVFQLARKCACRTLTRTDLKQLKEGRLKSLLYVICRSCGFHSGLPRGTTRGCHQAESRKGKRK